MIKIPDNKICKICNKQIVENSFASDSEKQNFYHVFCLEKLKLLSKIRELNALNSVDFKSLEIIFGILIDEVPNEIIPSSNRCRSENQHKIVIELDLDKKLELDIFSKAYRMDPKDFIKMAIKNEIDFIKIFLAFSNPSEKLTEVYKFKFDINLVGLRRLMLKERLE